MQKMVSKLCAGLLAAVAMPLAAQVVEPAVSTPAVAAPQAAPAMTEGERKASEERAAAQEKQAEAERKASEERIKEQEKRAEQERKEAEKRAEAERKAAEKAAAEAAAAEKLAADKLAADTAAAQKAAAVPAAVPLSKDKRDRVVQLCTAEAQRRGAALGATDVNMDEVQDTDVQSDGRASMQAKMNLITKDSKGRIKKQTKKVTCETKNDVVTAFKVK